METLWLEGGEWCHPDLEVLNTLVDVGHVRGQCYEQGLEPLMMLVIVKARDGCIVTLISGESICNLRRLDDGRRQAISIEQG